MDQRWKTAKEKALCFRCLSKDHHGKDCRRTAHCGIDVCSLSHHHLLQDPERKKGNAALRVPVNVSDPQRDASNETFMNEELAGALGLSTSWETVQVHVLLRPLGQCLASRS